MCWPFIYAGLTLEGEAKSILAFMLAFLMMAVFPVILIVVAFITGFFVKSIRYLSVLMPLMIYGLLGGYEDIYTLMMIPYGLLSVGAMGHWIFKGLRA
jgi:hypothetical protein